jgi:V8-like Glu-specific endopeptidase
MKKKITRQQFNRMLDEYAFGVPELQQMFEENLLNDFEIIEPTNESSLERVTIGESTGSHSETEEVPMQLERIVISTAGLRPVAKILNNQVTDQFLGKNAANNAWGPIIMQASQKLNQWIPAIGRIELRNSDMSWCGTGWLIDDDIIVTNRHVAKVFSQLDEKNSKFVFKPGLVKDSMSSGIDFLKEEGNDNVNEHPIVDILYVAPQGESDVAFLKVKQATPEKPLPKRIEIASEDEIKDGAAIVAIGYPAKDDSLADQALVISIFGDEVYDRKRLSPGKVKVVDQKRLHHDCSTLGGNSGSVMIDLDTGKAIGLHQGGFLDDSANIGVNIRHVKNLLDKVKNNSADGGSPENVNKPGSNTENANNPAEIKLNINIPLQITIKLGQDGDNTSIQLFTSTVPSSFGDIDEALKIARETIATNKDKYKKVTGVRKGYRFKDGWITDEKVIVIEVSEKLERNDILGTGERLLPREINGVGTDVRLVSPPDLLEEMGFDMIVAERRAKAAGYTEPPGFNDENSKFFLKRVRERMDAIFHVSPDAGFKELSDFFTRVKGKLTATIYEWEVNHVSDALEQAISKTGRSLKMVTQHTGVMGRSATVEAVEDMLARLGENKFEHVYASTRGPQRLIPNSYHIKVASRDGEEVWLSSGNWKKSNQLENPSSFKDLLDFNREWHAIIKNEKLAKLFKDYIDYDFRQATLFPLELKETADELPNMEFFVPNINIRMERIAEVTYQDTLKIENEVLDIQPLLTPDRDPAGGRIFMNQLIAMVKRATKSLYIQNQSFNLSDSNNEEFDELFEEIRKKQDSIDDVRLIIRDAHEFKRPKDIENQQKLLERLKFHGFNTSRRRLRLQWRCHTKGVIVDSKEVLLGSQNLTNAGSLVNRDASLLVRNAKVAKFYEKIFLYDWENLTDNQLNENVPPIRRAKIGEETPAGFKRVTFDELIGERM